MIKATIQTWRRKFREHVKAYSGLRLNDEDGCSIAFKNGKPMWNEEHVVDECCGTIFINVEAEGFVDKSEELRILAWLRRFAASMGRFSVDILIDKYETEGRYRMTYAMEIPELSKFAEKSRSEVIKDDDEFWIIGDPTTSQFMMVEDRGYHGDSCETTSDPLAADSYHTFKDAVDALCSEEDVILWAAGTPFPSRVRPLKVNMKVTVK